MNDDQLIIQIKYFSNLFSFQSSFPFSTPLHSFYQPNGLRSQSIMPYNSTGNSLVRDNAIGKPAPITFLEDRLRINFHSRFPLEALRPTVFKAELKDLPEDSIEFAIKRQAVLMEEFGVRALLCSSFFIFSLALCLQQPHQNTFIPLTVKPLYSGTSI